jgi:SAM-dependent methyltransferase
VSAAWKEEILAGAGGDSLPDGYERRDGIVGRADLLEATTERLWAGSEFVARARTPHTTSSVEARIRRRQIERMMAESGIDPSEPVLDLGCADGTLAHDLLELGFEKLVSTDILHSSVATLDRSLEPDQRDSVLLVVDDMLRLPLRSSTFGTVIAWGILSVSGDLNRALELAWSWVSPGGYLLHAEPTLEQALVYPLVRGDLDEFRRVQGERSRAGMWDRRDDRYPVDAVRAHRARLTALPGAEIAHEGGIGMLPSLVLGGLAQESQLPEPELGELSELLADPAFDDLTLWRQAFWLVRKR